MSDEAFLPSNCGSDVRINGTIATNDKFWWNTVYGNVIIDESIYPNAIYKWTIKTIEGGGMNAYIIGITACLDRKKGDPFGQRNRKIWNI